MSSLTGLFTRGSSYYLRVVLPPTHPARFKHRNGRVVVSLGACSKREAVIKGTVLRAEILNGDGVFSEQVQSSPTVSPPPLPNLAPGRSTATTMPVYLSDVFDKWVDAKPRSDDTKAACKRAVALFEEQTGNPPLANLSRAAGIAFRAWLQHSDRQTTSKTARDRLTWVKSLLKHAQIDLEVINRSPWEGLDIEQTTTHRRRPWTDTEVTKFFSQPLHQLYALPADRKAGADAAYWVPLLGMFTGARIGELMQVRCADVQEIAGVPVLFITDEDEGQHLKTMASQRMVPIHSELIRLGFLDYVSKTANNGDAALWPAAPMRKGKSGGYFSHWFGIYRRDMGFGKYPDFHCMRHTVRSALANAEVAEPMIDQLVGHEVKGSTGAKTYTHRTISQMKEAIERITVPGLLLQRVFPAEPSTSIHCG